MVIPAEKPVPIICSVCEMIDGDDLKKAIAEGSFHFIPGAEEKEEGENDPPEVSD
jgi:hypothetical protein